MISIRDFPVVTITLPGSFVHDKTRDGWRLHEDALLQGERLTLRLAEPSMGAIRDLSWQTLMTYFRTFEHRAGQHHAERLLSQEKSIPYEWRSEILLFPGTTWVDQEGDMPLIPYMTYGQEGWFLDFLKVGRDIHADKPYKVVCATTS